MTDASSQKNAKRRTMVYVPPDLHRAMEFMAVERDCSVSDLYVEATRAFLETGAAAQPPVRGPAEGPAPPCDASNGALAQILRRLDELADTRTAPGHSASTPVEARAMAVTLANLTRAGAEGLTREGMLNILTHEGFTRELGASVTNQLREYGLVVMKNMRLWLRNPVTVDQGKAR